MDTIREQCSASAMHCWADLHQFSRLSRLTTYLLLRHSNKFSSRKSQTIDSRDSFLGAYQPKHSTETALVRIHEDLVNIYLLPIVDSFDRHQNRYHNYIIIYADDTLLYAECPPSIHAKARKIDECVSDIRQ